MMKLSEQHTDALAELINIAFGLMAAKLSEISGFRVGLEPPSITSHPIETVASELGLLPTDKVASVHQVFSGPFSGDAILLLNTKDALRLSNLLVEKHLQSKSLDSAAGEILTEVGNMLLGACLSVFGNLLQLHVSFSVPQLHVESIHQLLNSISIGGDELKHAVVVTSSFNMREQGVDGRIVIVLGVSSLERLIQGVDQWENSQISR